MDTILGLLILAIGTVALIFGLGALFAFPTMWLINYLFSASFLMSVFGVAKLTFWKAYALDIVTALLFKTTVTSKK